jgi:hypothetical protein
MLNLLKEFGTLIVDVAITWLEPRGSSLNLMISLENQSSLVIILKWLLWEEGIKNNLA